MSCQKSSAGVPEAVSAITAAQTSVAKAQESLDTWTAQLHSCFDSQHTSSNTFEGPKHEINWLTEQVEKAREDLAKARDEVAKSREELAKAREELAKEREELAKEREYHFKLIESGSKKAAIPGGELFWKSLPSLRPVDDVLFFPHTPSFFPKGIAHSLLIRKSYVSLFKLILANLDKEKPISRIATTGNPGIGKSMFLFYVLWRLASTNEVGAVVRHSGKDAGSIFVFEKTRCWKTCALGDVYSNLALRNTWYLTDTLDPQPGEVNAVTILVASPGRKHYKTFLKYSSTDVLRYLPVWSLDELHQAACFSNISVKDVDERFGLIGGVARLVLGSLDKLKSEIKDALDRLAIEKFTSIVNGLVENEEGLCDVIVHNVVDSSFSRTSIQFCSAYIAGEAFDLFVKRKHQKLCNFLITIEPVSICAGLRGSLFEQFAHRVLSEGGTYSCRNLKPNENDSTTTEITLSPMQIDRFQDITKCEGGKYFVPWISNYPCIDAYIPKAYVFQMTISSHHPICRSQLKQILHNTKLEALHFEVP